MTDGEFTAFCSGYPDYFIEITAGGEIEIVPPNFSLTGWRNQMINTQWGTWAIRDGKGAATEASGGFVLQSGARRSPDAAWTEKARLRELDSESWVGYWHVAPDFLIELGSETDRLPKLRA